MLRRRTACTPRGPSRSTGAPLPQPLQPSLLHSMEQEPAPAATTAAFDLPSAACQQRRMYSRSRPVGSPNSLPCSMLCRLAQARAALGQWPAAVGACRRGHELSPKSSEGHSDFTPLWDWVAVHAARAGSLAGFDGQQLEVGVSEGRRCVCVGGRLVGEGGPGRKLAAERDGGGWLRQFPPCGPAAHCLCLLSGVPARLAGGPVQQPSLVGHAGAENFRCCCWTAVAEPSLGPN